MRNVADRVTMNAGSPRSHPDVLVLGAPRRSPAPRQAAQDRREDAYRANNIGVALLEQFQYDEAASSFRQALDFSRTWTSRS